MSYINNVGRYDSFTYKQNVREYNQIKAIQCVFTMSYLDNIKDVQDKPNIYNMVILFVIVGVLLNHSLRSNLRLFIYTLFSEIIRTHYKINNS